MKDFMQLSVDNRNKFELSEIISARGRTGFYHGYMGMGPVHKIEVKTSNSSKWRLYIKCLWPEEYYQIIDDLKIALNDV